MAFVPGFNSDIFISYAHVDNIPRFEDDKGWVTNFRSDLKRELAQAFGREDRFAIWADAKLNGNDEWNATISEALLSSAVLVSIFSPGYLASNYCMEKELKEFAGVCLQTSYPALGNKKRIFKVLYLDVPRQDIPDPLRTVSGYRFFDKDEETGFIKEFRRTRSSDPDQRYFETIKRLARDIKSTLEGMISIPPQPPERTLFLAEVAQVKSNPNVETENIPQDIRQLREYRGTLQRELTQRGFQVLPSQDLPTSGPELEETVRKDLAASAFSIHLMGAPFGRPPAGDARSTPQIQFEVAQEMARTARKNPSGSSVLVLNPLVWIVPEVQIECLHDERQMDFLSSLRETPDEPARAETLENTGIEELKDIVLNRFKQIQQLTERRVAPKSIETPTNTSEIWPTILIPHDATDAELAQAVKAYLQTQKFATTLLSNPAARLFERTLSGCDALLLLYGQAEDEWFYDTAETARRLPQAKDLKKYILEVCPPPKNIQLDWPNFAALRCPTGFDTVVLEDLTKALHQ